MSAHHFVELEGDAGTISARFICEAPEGSPCRMVWTCQCEDGYHSEECEAEYPDGPPLRDLGECNEALFIEAAYTNECASGGRVRVPVTTQWDDDGYIWDFDGDAA